MKDVNPLLVVNGRVNMNKSYLPVRKAEKEPTVIEANHMVNTHRVNTTILF